MGRRLVEFHADDYAKSKKSLRPAYEFKEKISRLDVAVNKEVSFSGKYSFSAQQADFRMENPWVDAKLIYDFRPDRRVMGDHSQDARVFVGYALSERLYFESQYSLIQGDTTLVWRQKLSQFWQGSVALSSAPYHEQNINWENRFITGVSRSY